MKKKLLEGRGVSGPAPRRTVSDEGCSYVVSVG